MDKKFISTSGLLIAFVLFVAVNVLGSSAMRFLRWDLTEDKLYTLSEGTRNILADLEDPITLRFYFSKDVAEGIPQIQAYAQRIQEMLEEYAALSTQLAVEIVEPEAFSEAEDDAVGYGLQGARIPTGEQLYMGLAGTNSVDEVETIPFFAMAREEFIEYDLSQIVYNLANLEQDVIGIMSSLPLRGSTPNPMQQPAQPWAIVLQLEKLFEIRWLDPAGTEDIPEDVTALVLVHPKQLSPATQFGIDQFVLRGGKLLAFVDPFCEAEELPPEAQQNPMAATKDSNLDDLFRAWGLEMESGKLAGCMDSAQRVQMRDGSGINFPVWLQLTADNVSADDFVTAELKSLVLHSAGLLKPIDGASTTFESLVSTTDNSMSIESMMMQFGPDPQRMVDDFVSLGQPLTLAARVYGPARTAFPDGKPMPLPMPGEDAPEPAPEPAPFLSESTGPINVIAIADVDLLADRVWAQISNFLGQMMIIPRADNGTFVTNCLENMCGSNDLISLRSRGSFHRPFGKKIELERAADERFRAKEQELEAKLQETETQLAELQQGKDAASALFLSPEQEAAVKGFRDEQLATRKELREVQHGLRRDIESLGSRLKFVNVLAIPLVILIGGLGVFALRSRKRN
ncbi:MAG: ABC-type uncharacterized transport system involved in gliding motility auxiliary subunit [Chlamydiales bacterium]|jgi:ABC-type uncharacterized transport system involved in gliding motility auxiliary subunit